MAEVIPRGIVVVAHGGREVGTEPVTATQLAVLRMIPLAWAIRQAVRDDGIEVRRPLFTVRGWNGAQASPVPDLARALDDIRARFGTVPVVLAGHSMGARAALRVAGHPAVIAVAGLAPWLPAGEPVDPGRAPGAARTRQRRYGHQPRRHLGLRRPCPRRLRPDSDRGARRRSPDAAAGTPVACDRRGVQPGIVRPVRGNGRGAIERPGRHHGGVAGAADRPPPRIRG